MRQWQICTSLHAVRSLQYLLRNKQITSVASLMRSMIIEDFVCDQGIQDRCLPVFTQDHSGSYSLSLQIPVQSSR